MNIQGAQLTDVSFINSNVNAVSYLLSNGNISIFDSKIFNMRLNESSINWNITNSTLEKIDAFQIHGNIKLTDSTLKDANFEFGDMDSFEAYNSTIDALGPATIRDKLIFKGGNIEWSGMNAGSVHLDGISTNRFAMTDGNLGAVLIENCKKADLLGFSKSNIDTLHIKNCDVGELGGHVMDANLLHMENVRIHDLELAESNIKLWKIENVQLTGILDFQLSKIARKDFQQLELGKSTTIRSVDANFTFP